jgi:histidinol phosphatase-like enzyme (inositol monophosphatase family)
VRLNKKYLEELLSFSKRIVKESSGITLTYFKPGGIKSSLKKDKSPVTIADLKCDDFLIKQIKAKYPSHSILSEENGDYENGSDFKWIIDPVDGTRNYMRGHPFWGTLAAVEFQGEVVSGVISMPAIDLFIFAARGIGCNINNKPCRVSKIDKIENSYLLYGGLKHILKHDYRDSFLNLVSQCNYTRGFGDCHGHSFVIAGMAEIMIDPAVAPYDIAPTKICVEEAGGKLTDFHGINSIYNKTALITNGLVHEEVLELLNEK